MKDLNYYKNNCEEDYIKTPISVLRYITELEKNNETKQLTLTDVVSSADYKHILQLMGELNTIMWESYMVKGKGFGRQEGCKIMGLLEQWAERH